MRAPCCRSWRAGRSGRWIFDAADLVIIRLRHHPGPTRKVLPEAPLQRLPVPVHRGGRGGAAAGYLRQENDAKLPFGGFRVVFCAFKQGLPPAVFHHGEEKVPVVLLCVRFGLPRPAHTRWGGSEFVPRPWSAEKGNASGGVHTGQLLHTSGADALAFEERNVLFPPNYYFFLQIMNIFLIFSRKELTNSTHV